MEGILCSDCCVQRYKIPSSGIQKLMSNHRINYQDFWLIDLLEKWLLSILQSLLLTNGYQCCFCFLSRLIQPLKMKISKILFFNDLVHLDVF